MKDIIKKILKQKLSEVIELPIEVGDTILMGKFKNKKVVVKDIDWDEDKGDLHINGKPALKMRIIKKLEETQNTESLTFNIIENMMVDEEYPSNFNIDEFKTLKSFNQRIKYCQQNLQRISSGSSRIVFKVDDEKVLKLAKNKKGLAQNEVEASYSNYSDLEDIVARVFEYDQNDLWIEMELARKVNKGDFKRVTGYSFEQFVAAVHNYGEDVNSRRGQQPFKMHIDKEVYADMWENEFMYGIFQYIGNYGIPAGDLKKLSTFGLVKRDGQDRIIIIDYGLTSDVYQSYYS